MHAYTYQLDDSEDKSTKLSLCIPDSLKLMFGAHGGRKELNSRVFFRPPHIYCST